MAMGKRKSEQPPLWIPTTELPVSPGHPFYRRLNEILDAAGFDRFVEEQCRLSEERVDERRQGAAFGENHEATEDGQHQDDRDEPKLTAYAHESPQFGQEVEHRQPSELPRHGVG